MNNFIKITFLLLGVFLTSCSEEKLSPEDEIKQYIESGKLAAESRNHSGLANLISKQYHDQINLDKKQLIRMLHAYFLTHKNIHLLTRIHSINFQDEKNAFVVLYIATAGNVISDLSTIASLRARVYKLELQLTKDDVWLLQQARWASANIKEML